MRGDCDVCDGWHPAHECFSCTWATVFNGAMPQTRILDRRDPTCAHHGDDTDWFRRVAKHAKALGGVIRPTPAASSSVPPSVNPDSRESGLPNTTGGGNG